MTKEEELNFKKLEKEFKPVFNKNMKKISNGLIGHAVGDALGVPHESRWRDKLRRLPVTKMVGFGSHNQPPGTWSDDTSLTLCLAYDILEGYSLSSLAKRCVSWMLSAEYTAHDQVFDIGNITRNSLHEVMATNFNDEKLLKRINAGDEMQNGNGTLMRIYPLLYLYDSDKQKYFELICEVSSVTHNHIRSAISCFIYLLFCNYLLKDFDKYDAYNRIVKDFDEIKDITRSVYRHIEESEFSHFDKTLNDVHKLDEDYIRSSAYVMDTLEASFWCFLNSDSYKEAVLKAVNLGRDTDTTAAVTGSIAGLYYGIDSIPSEWIEQTAKSKMILELGEKLDKKYK